MIELLMVTTILVMMAGAMAALASVVQSGSEFNHENNVVTQYGRVALERIERAVASATASNEFPGCFVYSEQLGGWTYPDTLIVWYPLKPAVNPDGLPLVDELVVFCPNPKVPSELLEIRLNNATGAAPALDDAIGWQALMAEFKLGEHAQRVPLSDLLRVATPTTDGAAGTRGVVRFDVQLRPSAAQWSEYEAGSRAWEDLSWAQGIRGSTTAMRQTWCRIELQLQPRRSSQAGISGSGAGTPEAGTSEADAQTTIPFFGSGTVYHELHRS